MDLSARTRRGENLNRRNFHVWTSHGQRGHMQASCIYWTCVNRTQMYNVDNNMTTVSLFQTRYFHDVRFCSYTSVRRSSYTQCDRPSSDCSYPSWFKLIWIMSYHVVRTNWRSTVNKMGITWEEVEVAALNRSEWRRSVAQCIQLDAGWIKVKVNRQGTVYFGQIKWWWWQRWYCKVWILKSNNNLLFGV